MAETRGLFDQTMVENGEQREYVEDQ
jgi:hypothetical protein